MQNVVPAQALSRRSRNAFIAALTLFLLAVLGFGGAFFLSNVPLVVPSNPNYNNYRTLTAVLWGVGILALLGAGALLVRALTWRQDNTLAQITGDVLAEALDARYILIRNISKRAIGYVDALLVGPAGVLVFRISNRRGVYYNEGAKWMLQKDQGKWQTLRWSPTTEAVADIQKVREYLASKGIPDPQVFGAVVFMQPPPSTVVTAQNPVVPVAQNMDLMDKLQGNYFSRQDRHDAATVTRIAELLYL